MLKELGIPNERMLGIRHYSIEQFTIKYKLIVSCHVKKVELKHYVYFQS